MDKARLTSQLKQAEGLSKEPYRDTRGFWTGGYGHLLDQTQDWHGVTFTDEQINSWLDEDTDKAIAGAQTLPEYPSLDTDARQNAVCELVFNMGLQHWRGFAHCRLGIWQKNWQVAHDQLLDSAWAGQVGKGRSTRLANTLLTGEY